MKKYLFKNIQEMDDLEGRIRSGAASKKDRRKIALKPFKDEQTVINFLT